jgi:5S rRNA maturation endonuclease (ribonuclease M5)
MPKKLLSAAESHQGDSWQARSGIHAVGGPVRVRVNLEPIRQQSWEIIFEILTDTDPEGSEIRNQLRRCLNKNRGNPERALLMHLMSMPGRSAPAVID